MQLLQQVVRTAKDAAVWGSPETSRQRFFTRHVAKPWLLRLQWMHRCNPFLHLPSFTSSLHPSRLYDQQIGFPSPSNCSKSFNSAGHFAFAFGDDFAFFFGFAGLLRPVTSPDYHSDSWKGLFQQPGRVLQDRVSILQTTTTRTRIWTTYKCHTQGAYRWIRDRVIPNRPWNTWVGLRTFSKILVQIELLQLTGNARCP